MWEALFTVALAAFVCFSAAAVMLGTKSGNPWSGVCHLLCSAPHDYDCRRGDRIECSLLRCINSGREAAVVLSPLLCQALGRRVRR